MRDSEWQFNGHAVVFLSGRIGIGQRHELTTDRHGIGKRQRLRRNLERDELVAGVVRDDRAIACLGAPREDPLLAAELGRDALWREQQAAEFAKLAATYLPES